MVSALWQARIFAISVCCAFYNWTRGDARNSWAYPSLRRGIVFDGIEEIRRSPFSWYALVSTPWTNARTGEKTLRLLNELDKIVLQSGGTVYPAKDAQMTPEVFQSYYPQWHEFEQYIDPHFSSSFWRRVTPRESALVPVNGK